MPPSVHHSQTSLTAARAERSLLRELGLPVSVGASSRCAHDGCASLFLRGLRARGLAFVRRREVPRRRPRMTGLDALGRVELSFARAARE